MSSPPTAHAVASLHFPRLRSGEWAWILCLCGAHVESLPDLAFSDPHQPLLDLWSQHRKAAGAGDARILGTGDVVSPWISRQREGAYRAKAGAG